MDYKKFPGAVPKLAIKVLIAQQADEPRATLHTTGAVPDSADYSLAVPSNTFTVPDALSFAATLSERHNVPMFVQVDEGASWQDSWGNLTD